MAQNLTRWPEPLLRRPTGASTDLGPAQLPNLGKRVGDLSEGGQSSEDKQMAVVLWRRWCAIFARLRCNMQYANDG